MAAFLGVLGAIGSVAAGLGQASAARAEARAQAQAANFRASIALQNAQIARQRTEANVLRQQRIGAKELGKLRAGFGASGVGLEGSPLDILADSAEALELDIAAIRYEGKLEEISFLNDVNLERQSASAALARGRRSASASLVGGLFSAAGSLAKAKIG